LIYAAIFREDSNCHCFGDLVELNPLESIIKNLILILLLLLSQQSTVNGQQSTVNGQQPTVNGQQPTTKVLVVLLTCSLLVFIISPPDSIYKMIYSSEKEVSSIDLYESFDEITKIDFKEDELIFDSISDFNTKENQLIVIVSSGCKYCKLGMKKLSLMIKNDDISPDNIDVFIWGSPEGIIDFRDETMTEDIDYWHIMPNKAIDITYGRFPVFIMIKEKDIIKVGDFRDLDDAFFK
jgi:thioredoxin-related protein